MSQAGDQTRLDRGACVVSGVYECGDLRLAQGTVATRVLNRAAAPALIYSSQHARPFPVVALHVQLPATSTASKVRLTLRGASGATLATREVAAWAAGQTRRVAIGFDASDPAQYPTGLYAYTLAVDTVGSAGTGTLRSETGTLAVVNRSRSRFGSGWWVAGLEQLHVSASDTTARLWVGGDGSTRVYRKKAAGVWAADAYDRPDTLRFDATAQQYVRRLPGRAEVRYNRLGLHVRTLGRTQLYSDFEWQGDTLLTRMHLVRGPAFNTGYAYALAYTGGRLDSIVAPGARTLRVAMDANRRVTQFTSPDGSTAGYGYADGTGRITRMTGALQHRTDFRYDGASRLAAAKRWMDPAAGAASDSLVTRFRAAEGLGVADPVAESDVYTLLDGPRADALPDGPGGAPRPDHVRFYLNRFGVPDSTVDPRGQRTRVERRDPTWPALVTRVVSPGPGLGLRRGDNTLRADSVRVTIAAYDGRGRLVSQTDSSTIVGGRAATSTYTWHLDWDALTSSTSAEGETAEMGYDTLGQRVWEQAGPEAGRRVYYRYYPMTSPASPGLVRAVQSPLRTDTLIYDARGNLAATHNFAAYANALGQDTLRVVDDVRTRLRYDAMGRVHRQTILGQDSVVVATGFDLAGRTVSTTRRMFPDPSSIGEMAESWTYDAAGRVLSATRGGATEHTLYDPAGAFVDVRSRRSDYLGGRLAVRTEYDVMGRVARRTSTPVNYREQTIAVADRTWILPQEYQARTIPGDSSTFTYDALGNLLTANNRDARITRTYLASGLVESETQEVRDDGSQFTASTFTYRYDRSGRLVRVRYPRALAYVSGSTVGDSVTYGYTPRSGDLGRVLDLEGNPFDFFYDGAGLLSGVQKPGGIFESYGYDVDGHLTEQVLAVDNAYVGTNGDELAGGRTEVIERGPGGKVLGVQINPRTTRESISSAYDAFGALRHFVYASRANPYEERELVSDPLGNVRYERRRINVVGTPEEYGNAYRIAYDSLRYSGGTGRLMDRRTYSDDSPRGINGQITQYDATEQYTYDDAGNQEWSQSIVPMGSETGGANAGGFEIQRSKRFWTRSYYDALNQLRYVDRVGCVLRVESGSGGQVAACDPWTGYQEMEPGLSQVFRYDALGRRVYASAAYEAGCLNGCESYTQQTLWSGDQVAGEIRGAMKVAYTHAAGIDQPLSLLRHGLSATPFTVVPHANWRGMYDMGTYTNGSVAVGPLNLRYVEWPGQRAGAYMNPLQLEPVDHKYRWMGSLISSSRDANGLMYRRNRYYDPNTGRFTQEDPIGIAGGLNLYAFGGGDPLTYRDPYGLSYTCGTPPNPPCPPSVATRVAQGATTGALVGTAAGVTCTVGTLGVCSLGPAEAMPLVGAGIGAASGLVYSAGEHLVVAAEPLANEAVQQMGQVSNRVRRWITIVLVPAAVLTDSPTTESAGGMEPAPQTEVEASRRQRRKEKEEEERRSTP